jgi:hypothetical protein
MGATVILADYIFCSLLSHLSSDFFPVLDMLCYVARMLGHPLKAVLKMIT